MSGVPVRRIGVLQCISRFDDSALRYLIRQAKSHRSAFQFEFIPFDDQDKNWGNPEILAAFDNSGVCLCFLVFLPPRETPHRPASSSRGEAPRSPKRKPRNARSQVFPHSIHENSDHPVPIAFCAAGRRPARSRDAGLKVAALAGSTELTQRRTKAPPLG